MQTISQYREAEGLTLEAFAGLVGKSKSHMHEVESTMKCSAKLALAIEAATKGAVKAAALNAEIAAAQQAAA
jgi:DNA-binding transcriptional regulator YdaS (Cro superfamily)